MIVSHRGCSKEEEGKVFEWFWVQSPAMGSSCHSTFQLINLKANHLGAITTTDTPLDGMECASWEVNLFSFGCFSQLEY
jgi:hypothetical protein